MHPFFLRKLRQNWPCQGPFLNSHYRLKEEKTFFSPTVSWEEGRELQAAKKGGKRRQTRLAALPLGPGVFGTWETHS